ncbi:MAG: peptidase domain-containing ABC transporter [Bacteroidales bacterium]
MINIKRIKEVSLLQQDSTDCGAACLASVIRYFGGNAGIDKIRGLSGTNQSGTTMLGLYQAAQDFGLEATGYEASVSDIMKFTGILILHVTPQKGYEHYIVSYGFSAEKFIIWDPAKGLSEPTPAEVDKIWLSHKCLAVSPGKGFVFEEAIKNRKRKWVTDSVKPEYELLLASVFVGVVIALLGVVMAVYTQKLLDRIMPSGDISMLVVSIILVFLLLSVRVLLTAVRQSMLLSQGKTYNIRVVDGFYSSLLGLPKPFFDTRKTGDMVARLNDTMRIQRVISDVVSTYVIDILIVLITVVMTFVYSTVAGLISVIALPLFFLLVHRWNKPVIKSQQDLMVGYALNESNFINTLRGITEIKSMNWQSLYVNRNKSIFSLFQERAFTLGKIKIKLGMLTNLAGILYLILLLLYASLEVMGTRMTQGELMAILSLSSTLLPSVMNLALISIPLSEAKVAIERMFEFTQLRPEDPGVKEEESKTQISGISLKRIAFRFPGQRLLLSDVSLDIEKGSVTALVGESGSGKSTLVNILMRFYQPESGSVVFNGSCNCHEVSLEWWRRSVGLIPQEIHIFNGTVLENIIPDGDETKIQKLVRLTTDNGLEPFVKGLPLGFATLTGEDGVKLSGGQKQVIAFMRALVNEPDILLIDEGTSGMDRDSETIILNILRRIKDSVGVLLVTHRINLVRKLCDRIYLLEDRTITAAGSHNVLIAGDNLYRRFWDDFS